MAGIWYYAHDGTKIGPYSARQLKELADAGTLLSSDTVWKDGVENGVLASRVKNLFAFVPADILPASIEPAGEAQPETAPVAETAASAPPEEEAAVNPALPRPQPPAQKKGKAKVIKGAEIVSQDGTSAKYRKVCTECGHKDSSTQNVALKNKTVRASFFCPKCRKRREVAVQCFAK